MNEYVVKYVELTDDEDFEDFTGRIDIEKVNGQLFTNEELDNLEKRFYSLPVVITDNETGVSLWLSDSHCVNAIIKDVEEKLTKM